MRPAQMDVRMGNQRRKKAAAAMLAQMQARAGNATATAGGFRQSGGLARAGAKAGMLRGQGRGIPAGLEGLYARAGDFARQNLGDYSLNAEQQPGAFDPGVYAGGYGIGNAINQDGVINDSGGQGGQQTYQAGEQIPAAPVGSNPFVTGQPGGAGQGGTATGDPEANAFTGGQSDINPFGGFSNGGPQGGAPQDGQQMNGGVYYQGTIIPMGVWRAMQQDGF